MSDKKLPANVKAELEKQPLSPYERTVRWAGIIGVALLFFFLFSSILTPYIIGLALAYFLDPVADYLERKGFKRIIAVTLITVVAAAVIILLLLIAIPLAFEQLSSLIINFPQYFDTINRIILERFPFFADFESSFAERIAASSQAISDAVGSWVLNSTQTLFGFISAFVIIPVVAFYMLYDWDRMTEVVDSWVPRDYLATYRYLTGRIDATLSGFVRGQGTVCLIMAAYYSISLTLVGLNYGFVIGLIAGILTFIPIVGGLVGGLLVFGVGFFQYIVGDGNWFYYIFVIVVYYAGQTIEGNFLTPRLVGNSVGLHPVWVMFALSAGAVVAGFTGMIVAVPVAAVVGVIGRYLLKVYKTGPLYLGEDFDENKYIEIKQKRREGDG